MSVTERVRARLAELSSDRPLSDQVDSLVRAEAPLLSPADHDATVAAVIAEVAGLGPLEPLLADQCVTEVMVNGPGAVWVERSGAVERTPIELTKPAIDHLIDQSQPGY